MNEKYKLLALLIEGYGISNEFLQQGWQVTLQEKIKNQIEESTGLKIEDVLKLHEINKEINWEKVVDRKNEIKKEIKYYVESIKLWPRLQSIEKEIYGEKRKRVIEKEINQEPASCQLTLYGRLTKWYYKTKSHF